jgi:hypothetical protein
VSVAAPVREVLTAELRAQNYCVLATADEHGQPYTSLMAFDVTSDLKHLVLLTNRATTKFSNLMCNRRVSVLIDNRENMGTDVEKAVAITAIGDADEAVAADECDALRAAYIARHPYMRKFATSPECAIMRVTIRLYKVVRGNVKDVEEVNPNE